MATGTTGLAGITCQKTPHMRRNTGMTPEDEERICTCSAGHGSMEGHLDWCRWHQVNRLSSLVDAALFALERLDEWSADYLGDEGAREWMGHVEPALERLRGFVSPHTLDPAITVCSACHCAACWQGQFMCDNAQSAATINLPRSILQRLAQEDPKWWDIDPDTGCARHLSRA